MRDHNLTPVVVANPGISPVQIILEHLLGGLCAGKHGPACVSMMAACQVCMVRPSVFMLQCVTMVISTVAARDKDMSASCGLDATTSGYVWTRVLASRLHSLKRLLSFKGERDYVLCFVRGMYDVSSDDLRDVSRAHGMGGIDSRTTIENRSVLYRHMMNGGCVANVHRLLLTMPIGCLEFLSHV